MPSKQGDISLVDQPLAQEWLHSTLAGRLAYIGKDGTRRVVPIWFHWTGEAILFGSPPKASKVMVLAEHPQVALTIESNQWPYRVLQIRGTASVQLVDGIPSEYPAIAQRYLGEEQGRAWVEQVRAMSSQMARIALRTYLGGLLGR
jgi:hypothetical protein